MTYINRQRQYRPKGSAVGKVAVHLQGDLPRNDTTVARHIFPPHPEKRRQYQALSLSTKNSRTKDPLTSYTFFARLRVRPAICPRLTYSGKILGDGPSWTANDNKHTQIRPICCYACGKQHNLTWTCRRNTGSCVFQSADIDATLSSERSSRMGLLRVTARSRPSQPHFLSLQLLAEVIHCFGSAEKRNACRRSMFQVP